MSIENVVLEDCALNLGQLHDLTDFGFFHPVFLCRTKDGERFAATMRLHITEPLDALTIVEPRAFGDGGCAANSAGSKVLGRRSGYDSSDRAGDIVLDRRQLGDRRLYRISADEIKKAILNGYDFQIECNNTRHAPTRDLKVAFTCHDPRVIGGGNTVLFRYVNWLADLGVGVTIYSCGHHPSWKRVKARFRNFSGYSQMFAAIEEDVVVLYSMWHIEPMLKARPRGKRVYHLRQIYEPFHYGRDYQSMLAKKPVIELLESLPLGAITVSPHLQQHYKQQLGIDSLLITNGIDTRLFCPPTSTKAQSKTKNIVSVGSPNHFVKGVNVLAKALWIFAAKRPDLHLNWTIVSGHAEPNALEGIFPKNLNVNHRSGLNLPQMRRLYQDADLVVNPSLYEGFGLPTLEAMACGATVVQADNRGLDLVVEHGRDCLMVPINDPTRMAEAIETIFSDERLTAHLTANGLQTVSRHSIAAQFDLFVMAFEEILQAPLGGTAAQTIRGKLQDRPVGIARSTVGVSPAENSGPRKPLVSVVIPTFNQAKFLGQALDSLLRQTYRHWEAIVVNDGSTDNTIAVLNEYAQRDSRIKPVTRANGGITSALNEGLKHCCGEYFSWLSSDDLYYPEKLEVLAGAFESLTEDYALVYGSFDLLREQTGQIEQQPFAQPLTAGAEFPEALKFDFVDGCSMLIRMDVMREVGGFNPCYRHSQDMELWMRIACRGYRFGLVNKKVAIRRVHVEQSSTTNMIHCRYDAARMINYYLEHFHLLEMYRYFDLTKDEDIDRFVEHLVGRMLHTEANINHPVIQGRFWQWFDRGLTALAPNVQVSILKKCLNLMLSKETQTHKMEFYIEQCISSLSKNRRHVPFVPDLRVEGRDILRDEPDSDVFAKDLFDYGTDLLVNDHTPLFAQELYFHNTNKLVDTPYKLAHSVFRYLGQYDNPYHQVVRAFADVSQIPRTREQAIRLFCSLRYPELAEAFGKSLAFDPAKTGGSQDALGHEQQIARMPSHYKDDLQQVCRRNPTETILYYWNALPLAEEGRFAEALEQGWKTLTLGRETCDWRIAYRLGTWAERAGDLEKAAIAYRLGRGACPSFAPFTEGLTRVSQKAEEHYALVPTPKPFIFERAGSEIKDAALADFKIRPLFNGSFIVDLTAVSENGQAFNVKGTLPYKPNFEDILVADPYTNKRLKVSANSIFRLWSAGYNFAHQSSTSLAQPSGFHKAGVAFTILDSSVTGGGPLIVFRYVNWLAALGVDVAVYSNDDPPPGLKLDARFHRISDEAKRYASITEPVVIAYSVLELPALLRYCKTEAKRIFHLCQGAEDFNYHGHTYASLMAPKAIFEILHSLPVGRLAVSAHIKDYFNRQYHQRTHTILNGIDLSIFTPRPKRTVTDNITVMIVGSPDRLLKGSSIVRQALALLADKHPEWKLHLNIVSGQKVVSGDAAPGSSAGFTCSVHWGLVGEEMRRMYHQTDVYVNCAWYEGFGLPSLEAMACGVPVIQADNRGLDGIAADRQNCLMVPPHDPRIMAQALEDLIKDHELRDRLIAQGLETASGYSLGNQFEMFVGEFEDILNRKFDPELVEATRQEIRHGSLQDRLKKLSSKYQPLISVLVPTYNQAEHLKSALSSLLLQTYPNWEAVVVNDGSTDETPLVLEWYVARDRRIRVFHKQNGGAASALNEALRHARGKWICRLSSDDMFEPDRLATLVYAFEQHPDIRFFHTYYSILDGKTGRKGPGPANLGALIPPVELQVLKLFEINYFSGNSVAVHREVLDQVGGFSEEYGAGRDLEMWLRISALYRSHFINKPTCVTRLHPDQQTDFAPGRTAHDSPGVYDSARACLEFLNEHQFPQLFPDLDLSDPRRALFAARSTLNVVVNPRSFINRCGFAPALMDRLYEWLTNLATPQVRALLEPKLAQIISQIQLTNLPHEIKVVFPQSSELLNKPFEYKSYDPVTEMTAHVAALQKSGQTERASQMKQYLDRFSRQTCARVSVENRPHFSILVPCYNQARFLPEALDSIRRQTCPDWEAVVVNDGSTDDTAQVMAHYAHKDPRIRIVQKENGGVASALNEGIRNAKGDWICWLSADDFFEPDKLQIHLKYIKENSHIRFFHTNYLIFNEEAGEKRALLEDPRELVCPIDLQVLKYFERNCANGISVAIHRKVFDDVGLFDEKYRHAQDFDMWLRINARYRAMFIDHKTVVSRWHKDRGTTKFPHAGFYDSCRACVEFMNTHKFGEYFPMLDLTTLAGAKRAVGETMLVAANRDAMMYKCYFNTLLLERLTEWLAHYCPESLKQVLLPNLKATVAGVINSQASNELRAALCEFSENMARDFHFRPHEFTGEAAQYAQRLSAAGQSERAAGIRRYLAMSQSPEPSLPETDTRQPIGRETHEQQSDRDLPGPSHHAGEPLVSVIMPAHNAATHIAKAIQSVLNQSYRDIELIVVDDGSTDNTADIVTGFEEDRIKYFYQDNAGASSARNLALRKSQGSYIVILDADDMMTPDFIARHLEEFDKHPQADLVYCDDSLIDENDKPIRVIERPEYADTKSLVRDLFRCGYPVVPFRTCIRKSVFDKIGFYDEGLLVAEDYDMMRRFVKSGLKAHHLNEALYLRRIKSDSLSAAHTAEKAKCHFDVLKRFSDTFSHDELFGDVGWDRIPAEMRSLHAKCLAAVNCVAIGRTYVQSNSPIYAQTAFGLACSQLNDCTRMHPNNQHLRQLLQQCESVRNTFKQALCRGAGPSEEIIQSQASCSLGR